MQGGFVLFGFRSGIGITRRPAGGGGCSVINNSIILVNTISNEILQSWCPRLGLFRIHTNGDNDSSRHSNCNPPVSDGSSTVRIDAASPNRKPIALFPGIYHSPATHALWEARSTIFENPNQRSNSDVVKTPAQSRTSIFYNFSSDDMLREQYRNPWNEMRVGKLLEDLDALAGTIAFKHCCNEDGSTRPLLLVTASVDKMVLKKHIRVDADLSITGAVTWVGRSSMEIQLQVTQGLTSDSE